ncbi:MAG: hypothetical protein ACLFPX_00750 [Candidatus Omnitrophota bacterium]
MRKEFFVGLACVLAVCLSAGCGRARPPAALDIDGISVTAEEFERAFQQSRYAGKGEKAREQFLDQYIDTKLILKEAVQLDLDKQPEFLAEIQSFWEQALLKRMIRRKTEQLAEEIPVSEQEVRAYYDQYKDTRFSGQTYDKTASQIRFVLRHQKQVRELEEWIASLRASAQLKIRESLLGIQP